MLKNNLLNRQFGRLTVLERSESINKRSAWLCLCSCGNKKIIKAEYLLRGHTKSCGCLNQEKRSGRAKTMYSVSIKYSPIESNARTVWRKTYKDIKFEDFYRISQMDCYYCGLEPSNKCKDGLHDKKSSEIRKEAVFVYNGLDRVNSEEGHSIDNVVPCCWPCNYAKRDRTISQFTDWIIKIYDRLIRK